MLVLYVANTARKVSFENNKILRRHSLERRRIEQTRPRRIVVDGRTADFERHRLVVPARTEIQSARLLLPLNQRHDQYECRESSDNVVFLGSCQAKQYILCLVFRDASFSMHTTHKRSRSARLPAKRRAIRRSRPSIPRQVPRDRVHVERRSEGGKASARSRGGEVGRSLVLKTYDQLSQSDRSAERGVEPVRLLRVLHQFSDDPWKRNELRGPDSQDVFPTLPGCSLKRWAILEKSDIDRLPWPCSDDP